MTFSLIWPCCEPVDRDHRSITGPLDRLKLRVADPRFGIIPL